MNRHVLRWFVIALAVSLFGAIEGVHLMASLNDPLPSVLAALHAHADPLPARPASPTHRVVVVLIDGLGAAPFDALLREGILGEVPWEVSLDSGIPSRSRPVYHAILTGIPQWAAGIRANGFATERVDSVPDRVRAGGGKVAWMLESEPWFFELFGSPDDLLVEGSTATSPATFERVWSEGADLTVVHLLEVDEAGHLYGAASPEYSEAARRTMGIVSAFRSIARARPGSDNAIWLVGADHGHTKRGGHGGPEEAVRRVSWVAFYPGASSTGDGSPTAYAGAYVTALAPTIARALGVDAPRESMADGLALLPALLGEPFRANPSRIEAAESARAASQRTLLGDARSRGALIVGVLAATFAALISLRRRQGLAEVSVFVVAILGFLIVGPGLSMSSVRTEKWYLAHALVILTVFAAVAWTVARKWASPSVVAAVCAMFPLLALGAMRGSLGRSDATPIETVLWPSLGLVPASVCTAIAFVELIVRIGARKATRPESTVTYPGNG